MANDLITALVLAVIQGITEWLPVSSSGHLVLFEGFFEYSAELFFDVALHFGTLMAVFVYFGKDIIEIVQDLLEGKWKSEKGRIGLMLIVASVPAAIVGFFVRGIFDFVLRDLRVVALGFGVTGLMLLISGVSRRRDEKLGYVKALLIGVAQALSIIPGISRSGSTIASGVYLGLSEKSAMKFSFLMSIPIIFGANLVSIGNSTLPSELIFATLVSFVVGLLTIHIMFKHVLVNRKNFKWFGFYCFLLALAIGSYLVLV